MSAIVVIVTASNEEEAAKIGKALVDERLAACANIVPKIRSIYRWEGKVQDDPETLMLIKTTDGAFDALLKRVKELHSYSVPEIIALPIGAGSSDYLSWIEDSTGPG
ncbi:MAG: divalent-cation tolerance protein CutA [Thermodesulfovibrionales bacterium]|nr:divalent-cation tolerance protein CutA [Thermodesulfovibrionales bacterium]